MKVSVADAIFNGERLLKTIKFISRLAGSFWSTCMTLVAMPRFECSLGRFMSFLKTRAKLRKGVVLGVPDCGSCKAG